MNKIFLFLFQSLVWINLVYGQTDLYLTYNHSQDKRDIVSVCVSNLTSKALLIQEEDKGGFNYRLTGSALLNSPMVLGATYNYVLIPPRASYLREIELECEVTTIESLTCYLDYTSLPISFSPIPALSGNLKREELSAHRSERQRFVNDKKEELSLKVFSQKIETARNNTITNSSSLIQGTYYYESKKTPATLALCLFSQSGEPLLIPLLRTGLKGKIDYVDMEGQTSSWEIRSQSAKESLSPCFKFRVLGDRLLGDDCINVILPVKVKEIIRVECSLDCLPLVSLPKYETTESLLEGLAKGRRHFVLQPQKWE